jgi:hypothetical protein
MIFKPVAFIQSVNNLSIVIRKTRSRMERLLVFSIIALIIAVQINSIISYLIFAIILGILILYFLSFEILSIDIKNSLITKETFLFNWKLYQDFSFELSDPLEINCIKYNNRVDGDAFNFYRFEFYIEVQRKYLLFRSDEDEVFDLLQKFFQAHQIKFNDHPIKMIYRGLVEKPT